jgi:hypothetical protein
MKFAAGVLLGLLLSGPAVHRHIHVTEYNTFEVRAPRTPAVEYLPVPLEIEVIDGQEWCVVELLGGPSADWDAADVMAVLDEAWLNYDGPCDMKERADALD